MRKILMKGLSALLILITITYIAFTFLEVGLVKAERRAINQNRSQAEVTEKLTEMGFYDPIHIKYTKWASNVLKGNLGDYYDSKVTPRPVNDYLYKFMGRTILLNGVAFLVAIGISVPLGVLAAVKVRKKTDTIILILTMIFTSVPSFYFGLLLVLSFVRHFPGILPVSGIGDVLYIARGYPNIWVQVIDVIKHMILPGGAIALVWIGTLVPFIRTSMLEVMHQDYVRTAKAKGLKLMTVFFKHTFRNALLPMISITVMLLPTLVISNILVEQVFSWPGMGFLLLESINKGERDMVMAILLLYAIIVILGNLLSELLIKKADARLSQEVS